MFLIFRVTVISTNMCPISIPYSVGNSFVSIKYMNFASKPHSSSMHTKPSTASDQTTPLCTAWPSMCLFSVNSSWLHPYIWDLTPSWAVPYIPLILWIFSALIFPHASFFPLPIWREDLCISLCTSSTWQYNSFHLVKEQIDKLIFQLTVSDTFMFNSYNYALSWYYYYLHFIKRTSKPEKKEKVI